MVEEVRTPQLPIHMQALVISLSLEKTHDAAVSGKMLIHFITPDQQQNLMGSGEMQIPPEQKRMKAVFRFGNFPIQQFGRHRFVVSWVNESQVKEGEAILDFDVIQVTQVAQGVAPASKPDFSH